MRLSLVIAVCLLINAPCVVAVSPYNSIEPEKPKSTAYGLQIVRSNEVNAGLISAEVLSPAALPATEAASSYWSAIEDLEKLGGPYDLRLAEPLHGMGKALMNGGEPVEAMRVFSRALQVSRINEGLNARAQLPVLKDMIELHLLLGQFDRADELVEKRFRVQKEIFQPQSDDWKVATEEYIDWQRQAYLQGIGGSSYLRLLEMHDVYSENIEKLQDSPSSDTELIQQFSDRMLVEYLISRYDGERQSMLRIQLSGPADSDPILNGQLEGERFRQLRKNNYRNGRRALEAIIEAATRVSGPESEEVAEAYVALGDWYMWWQEESRALQSYERAWSILDGAGLLEPGASPLFSKPVELPDTKVFLSDGSVPTEDVKARAKVVLTVSKYGEAHNIEIVEQEPPEDVGARVVLFRLLRDVRFRPAMREGKSVAWTGVQRDYRYQY